MRVLILDPNIINQHYLKTQIEEAGILTDVSSSIEEVEMFMFSNKAELLIMASETLSTAELQAIRKWRREGRTIRIMILNSSNDIEHKVKAFESGADDYVTKPFVAKELIARIRAVTRRKSETESPNLTFENITLNRSTCELSSDKASVRLANKEYQMLEMFMSNPRQIISPDRFMEKIWGFDSDTEQNVVWVYISYLRKKLAKVGANVQIKAARNMGYSLEAKND